MARKIIVFKIRFNSFNFEQYKDIQFNRIGKYFNHYDDKTRLTEQWIDFRMSVFMKYTLQSLKLQTNQQFLAFVQYDDSTEKLVRQAANRYGKLPGNIILIKQSEYEEQLKQSILGYKYLYMVNLDSDDMYHKSFVQQLHDYNKSDETIVLFSQNGYIYDSIKNKLSTAHYTFPSFYTMIYKVDDYCAGQKYRRFLSEKGIRLPKIGTLRPRNFVYIVHSMNTVHDQNLRNVIRRTEAKKILAQFMGVRSNEKS